MRHSVRLFGDPVLRQRASEIDEIDSRVALMADGLLPTMYEAEGLGLAAPQVGIQKRLFVYDIGDGPQTLVNPEIVESDGEWPFDEGCLSLPGMTFEIIRPKQVHLVGRDLDGNEVSIEADELLARLFLHELDHLDGVLTLDHLERDVRKAALAQWRRRLTDPGGTEAAHFPAGGITDGTAVRNAAAAREPAGGENADGE
ncbi:MAG TPA: peptide deformylase, partial [Acidimicrobiaceae bacterium]|nr:peptide deformylase [Acidimicrobiaceae bacterium]